MSGNTDQRDFPGEANAGQAIERAESATQMATRTAEESSVPAHTTGDSPGSGASTDTTKPSYQFSSGGYGDDEPSQPPSPGGYGADEPSQPPSPGGSDEEPAPKPPQRHVTPPVHHHDTRPPAHQPPEMARTGTEETLTALAASGALLAAGTVLYRRGRRAASQK
ncbi:hypothetical protein [Streptomyces sp. MMG1121]|uniref:hypothetical protein n=1 Tax=Streptomyces sp. MMG1121 TaxID=1415544 RepID=UPI0006AE9605|nr:hypothetical protein [Streptomyces sp. MMG1121]